MPDQTPDECTGCGRDDGPLYLDTRPRHPADPQAVYCRDCAGDLFDLGEELPAEVRCPATFEPVPEHRRHTTHTCDLPEHDGRAHHCPVCGTDWEEPGDA
ncbi:hypothetical protein [Actinomadura litoris]|uniref:hypothetical protein n=1 Tax=Actinomadura litoris TaxID=2678616 RepID=UPI001FA7F734|nr:hypothetical protein [Actinomadura litoris]